MLELIAQYQVEIAQFQSVKADEIEQFRIKYLGTKGLLKTLFEDFKKCTQ
jgi:phenylalanyl-tRNA synthetase alpha chain